jgi:hypothetical protein
MGIRHSTEQNDVMMLQMRQIERENRYSIKKNIPAHLIRTLEIPFEASAMPSTNCVLQFVMNTLIDMQQRQGGVSEHERCLACKMSYLIFDITIDIHGRIGES